jgi:uncharacterized membrane protein
MAKQKFITPDKPQNKRIKDLPPPPPFLFRRENYMVLGAGLVLLALGFLLMTGCHQPPNQFDPNIVYGFTTITLSTIITLLGFAVVLLSIFWKRKIL